MEREPMIDVVEGCREDVTRCLSIAESLPQYFTPKALKAMKQDLAGNPFYVARDEFGQVLGFTSVKKNTEQTAELKWLAVATGSRRQGVGTVIVETVCSALRAKGLKLLLARTLSKNSDYHPYESSRRFLQKTGFIHIDTIDPYPDWEPGNPCDVYARIL
jgi:N-acetylglutamate synthase-like GNAT family acetyltransferase